MAKTITRVHVRWSGGYSLPELSAHGVLPHAAKPFLKGLEESCSVASGNLVVGIRKRGDKEPEIVGVQAQGGRSYPPDFS